MRLKIGYFSPMPPVRSGIARYSECLLPYLAKLADVTLFETDDVGDYDVWRSLVCVEPIENLHESWWLYDALIYNMGNSFCHDQIYHYATLYSGIVVLHDHGLHHFLRQRGRKQPYQYIREMAYEGGRDGLKKSWRALLRQEKPDYFEYPLNQRLLDMQFGTIVHSHYTQELITKQTPSLNTAVIPLLDTNYLLEVTPFSMSDLKLPDDALVMVTAGQVTSNKQIDLLLKVFEDLRDVVPNLYLVIAGEVSDRLDLDQMIGQNETAEYVIQTGFVSDHQTFSRWLLTADIVVNLRFPTLGETSSVVLQALSLARPTVVFDHGWYAELDDDACIKVPVMDEIALFQALLNLASSPEMRLQIGRAGRLLIERDHHPESIANAYIEFVENL